MDFKSLASEVWKMLSFIMLKEQSLTNLVLIVQLISLIENGGTIKLIGKSSKMLPRPSSLKL
jgi:hypothetical protein